MNADLLDRFRKLCSLLGSEHEGERATAAKMATTLLKRQGFSWSQVGVKVMGPAQMDESVVAEIKSLYTQIGGLRRTLGDRDVRLLKLEGENRALKDALKRAQSVGAQPRRFVSSSDNPFDMSGGDPVAVVEKPVDDGGQTNLFEKDLRRRLKEALEQHHSGKIELQARTLEFFVSLSKRRVRWTDNQLAAAERTLGWVFAAQSRADGQRRDDNG